MVAISDRVRLAGDIGLSTVAALLHDLCLAGPGRSGRAGSSGRAGDVGIAAALVSCARSLQLACGVRGCGTVAGVHRGVLLALGATVGVALRWRGAAIRRGQRWPGHHDLECLCRLGGAASAAQRTRPRLRRSHQRIQARAGGGDVVDRTDPPGDRLPGQRPHSAHGRHGDLARLGGAGLYRLGRGGRFGICAAAIRGPLRALRRQSATSAPRSAVVPVPGSRRIAHVPNRRSGVPTPAARHHWHHRD